MDINKVIGWYYNHPRLNDIAGWNEIHRALGTPEGSDATMRAWALARMRELIRHCSDCNNVAPTAKLAQDATQGQPAQTVGQTSGSDALLEEAVRQYGDLRNDLEAMRKDLDRLFALSGKMHDFWSDEEFEEYKAIGRKWGLQ